MSIGSSRFFLPNIVVANSIPQWLTVRRLGWRTPIVAVALCAEPQSLETRTQNDALLVNAAGVNVCEVAPVTGFERLPDVPSYHWNESGVFPLA